MHKSFITIFALVLLSTQALASRPFTAIDIDEETKPLLVASDDPLEPYENQDILSKSIKEVEDDVREIDSLNLALTNAKTHLDYWDKIVNESQNVFVFNDILLVAQGLSTILLVANPQDYILHASVIAVVFSVVNAYTDFIVSKRKEYKQETLELLSKINTLMENTADKLKEILKRPKLA